MRKGTLFIVLCSSFLVTLGLLWLKRPATLEARNVPAPAAPAMTEDPVVPATKVAAASSPVLPQPMTAAAVHAPPPGEVSLQRSPAPELPQPVLRPGEGWLVTGSGAPAGLYSSQLDHVGGEGIVRLMSIRDVPRNTFGAMVQSVSAAPYEGKRVRLTASLSTIGAVDKAGIWFRADAADRDVAFANTLVPEESLSGNTDWTERSIVLDIPRGALRLNYGSLISGAGEVRMQKVRIEVVDSSVPVTVRGPAR